MENTDTRSVETLPNEELSALARIFGDFLKRKSTSAPEIMAAMGEKLITAREKGDSFITLGDGEYGALQSNPHLLTGEKALFVLEGKELYLYREHKNEVTLAHAIAERLKKTVPLKKYTREEITKAFLKPDAPDFTPHENQIDAVANCLESCFSIITGGPGTGKTTIIAALVALEAERDPDIKIEIAAPTGKAAELLTKGLSGGPYPVKAHTLHSLFKARPGSGRFGKNASDPLECDLLIVDECSMISLDVAAKVFQGLSPETRVVLSGDHRQLEAIGSGAVLSSLLTFSSDNSPAAERLKKAGVELTANYRSKLAPTIQGLAKAMREKEEISSLCQKIVSENSANYSFQKSSSNTGKEILSTAANRWQKLPELCKEITEDSVKKAFEILKSFRVLTAQRVGKEGCSKLNEKILKELDLASAYSPGSALLITENCHRTGLSNGDVGIVFADKEAGGIRICFEHLPVPLQFHDLPPHESAFAMTVHKAQGSGFDEVSFPMPQEDTPLLTRELFYTALTRAAKKITIYGNADMVQKALERESCRAAKLAERIVAELKGEQQ